jgi:hypothetical protein
MARLQLLWLHYRFGRKQNGAADLPGRRDPGDESGYWALVDATMRDTGTANQ